MPARPRIVVVDADRRVRESLTEALTLGDRLDVAGSAGHVEAALELCDRVHPYAIVIDPRLPEVTDGIALISRLRNRHPRARILVLAWSPALERIGDPQVVVVPTAEGPGALIERIHDLALELPS